MTSITNQGPVGTFIAANETHVTKPGASAMEEFGGHDDMDKHITNPHVPPAGVALAAVAAPERRIEPSVVREGVGIVWEKMQEGAKPPNKT